MASPNAIRRRGLAASVSLLAAAHSLVSCTSFRTSPSGVPDAIDAAPAAAAVTPSPFEVVHSLPDGPFLNAVWGVNDDTIFAVGTDGVKYSSDHGQWTRRATLPGREYVHVWGTKVTDVYAVGTIIGSNKGVIEHFDGEVWTDEYVAPTPIWSLWGDGTIVLAVGPGGYIYGKKEGTKAWAQRGRLTEPDVPDFYSVVGNGKANLTLVADRRIYHTTNFGDFPWFEVAIDPTLRFFTAWAAPGSETNVFIGTNHLGVAWMYSPALIQPGTFDAGSIIQPDAALEDIKISIIHRDESVAGSETLFMRGICGKGTKRYFVGDKGRVYAFDVLDTKLKTIESGTRDSLRGAWASSTTLWVVGAHELVLSAPLP